MEKIKEISVGKPIERVYGFMKNINLYKNLLGGKVRHVNSEGTVASIDVPGFGESLVVIKKRYVNEKVFLVSRDLGLELEADLREKNSQTLIRFRASTNKILVKIALGMYFDKAIEEIRGALQENV